METDRPSKTAMMVAAYRARATARPNRICVDEWAAHLAGEEGQGYARLHDEAFPPAELWLALRTATIDRAVERLTVGPSAFTQVCILGAGLDTRAARLARPGVRYFEVDHPATQTYKRDRLAELPEYPQDAATYVTCDFEHENFLDRLVASGFDAQAPAVFVWEGVAMYLPERAVRETLSTVASRCDPRTVLIFDYLPEAMATGEVDEAGRRLRELLSDLVEPVRFGTDDVLPLLYGTGFRWVHTRSFDELCLELTGTYDRARRFRFQRIAMTSRVAPERHA